MEDAALLLESQARPQQSVEPVKPKHRYLEEQTLVQMTKMKLMLQTPKMQKLQVHRRRLRLCATPGLLPQEELV